MSAQGNSTGDVDDLFRNVTECALHNATYTARFAFSDSPGDDGGGQRIDVLARELGPGLPRLGAPASSVAGPTPAEAEHMAYQAVVDAVGWLLVGAEHGRGGSLSQTYGSSFQMTGVRWEGWDETQRDLEELFTNVTLSMFASRDLM